MLKKKILSLYIIIIYYKYKIKWLKCVSYLELELDNVGILDDLCIDRDLNI